MEQKLETKVNQPDGSNGLSVSEPEVNLDLLSVIDLGNVNRKVLELSLQRSFRAFNNDLTGLHLNSD